MSGEAITAVYDITKNAIFSKRRLDKAVGGDIGSYAVATGQIRNGVAAVAKFDNMVGHATSSATKAFDAGAKATGALGYAVKGVNWAAKNVNPLICVTSGIRVLKAEDKTSEAINQAYGLAGMFAFEKTSKLFMTPEGRAKLLKNGFGEKGISKTLMNAFANLDKIAGAAGASKWAKIGIPALKAVGFVCASIGGWALGSHIAGKINTSLKNQNAPAVNS